MLTIYDVTSATDAKNYYASSVSPEAASARRDYYSEGQESPGLYGGKLAEELGLAGKSVDKETFDRLCDNLHPTGRYAADAAYQRLSAGMLGFHLLRAEIVQHHRSVRQRG